MDATIEWSVASSWTSPSSFPRAFAFDSADLQLAFAASHGPRVATAVTFVGEHDGTVAAWPGVARLLTSMVATPKGLVASLIARQRSSRRRCRKGRAPQRQGLFATVTLLDDRHSARRARSRMTRHGARMIAARPRPRTSFATTMRRRKSSGPWFHHPAAETPVILRNDASTCLTARTTPFSRTFNPSGVPCLMSVFHVL